LAAGMDDYLSKPLVFKELVKTIHRYIETSVILSEPPNKIEIISVKYNKSMTMQQLELDEETVDMLLNDFFATLDDALNTLRKAIEINDNITISKAAHYLKGSCANLVMQEAEELLKEMEINAKENKNAHYEIERLEQVFEKIKATL
jgi:HPt (histidine-containing phosphotransfer) domain-containing protein